MIEELSSFMILESFDISLFWLTNMQYMCLTLDHCEIVRSQVLCGIQANFYNSITLYYTLEHMYNNIMVCSIQRLIVYPSPCAYKWIKIDTRVWKRILL